MITIKKIAWFVFLAISFDVIAMQQNLVVLSKRSGLDMSHIRTYFMTLGSESVKKKILDYDSFIRYLANSRQENFLFGAYIDRDSFLLDQAMDVLKGDSRKEFSKLSPQSQETYLMEQSVEDVKWLLSPQ